MLYVKMVNSFECSVSYGRGSNNFIFLKRGAHCKVCCHLCGIRYFKLTGTALQSPLQCLTLGVLSLIRQIPHSSLNDGIKQLLEQKMGPAPRNVQLPHSSGTR